jgi:pyruvate/2-oxoglutarate dehydrogenase complex dihydrolipoamide acyltransferase (E2) component
MEMGGTNLMGGKVIKVQKRRKLAVVALQIASRRRLVHGMLEADVTDVKKILKKNPDSFGGSLSMTGYIIACFARAIQEHPDMRTYTLLFNRRYVFDEVDVSTLIDHPKGKGIPVPYVVKNAHMKSVREITDELRGAKTGDLPMGFREKLMPIASQLPNFLIAVFFKVLRLVPGWMRFFDGTAQVSSVGMFGDSLLWAFGLLYMHTVGLWVGTIKTKPMAYKDKVALRDCLHIGISIDHDIIDGAPGTRFTKSLVDYLEEGNLFEQ